MIRRCEKFDEYNRGTISLDSFSLVLIKMDFPVSNKEIADLAKLSNPDVERLGQVDYVNLMNKIFS